MATVTLNIRWRDIVGNDSTNRMESSILMPSSWTIVHGTDTMQNNDGRDIVTDEKWIPSNDDTATSGIETNK